MRAIVSTSVSTQARLASLPITVSARCGPQTGLARAASMAGRYSCPVTGDVDGDLRDLPWAGARGGKRTAGVGEPRAWRPGPFSFPAGAVPAGLADLQADGPAPSWLVRVGTFLALHFPGGTRRLCLDRPGLLVWELGRHVFAILPGPAAEQTHSAAKKTHGVIVGHRLADFPYLGLRGRSAGRSTVFRAYQRQPAEWLDCEYRNDRQADRRGHRRVVAQCHAESDHH